MIESFFDYIAYRKRSENDLSDITWALCNASHSFQTIFLKFFFPTVEFTNITQFEREKSEDDSRPDFLIVNNNLIYLIECKIYDRKHHFEQYTKIFDVLNDQLGYITNYQMRQEGFVVHTWEELFDEINKNFPNNEIEAELWRGYSIYLKNVCSIIKITKKMDLKGMHSLYSFNEIIKKLSNSKEAEYELSYYSNKNIVGGTGISGNYFEIKYINFQINTTWAWIGVYYESEDPTICIGFENKEGWGKPVYDLVSVQLNKINKGLYADKPYFEDGALWFELTSEKHEEFENCNLNGQIQILKEFMDEIIKVPTKLLQ